MDSKNMYQYNPFLEFLPTGGNSSELVPDWTSFAAGLSLLPTLGQATDFVELLEAGPRVGDNVGVEGNLDFLDILGVYSPLETALPPAPAPSPIPAPAPASAPIPAPSPSPARAPAPGPGPGAGRPRTKTTGAKTPGPASAGISKQSRAPRPASSYPASAPLLPVDPIGDDSDLTVENYRPNIEERLVPTLLTAPNQHYGPFRNRFSSGEAARAYRESSREQPKAAQDVERVKKYGRLFWVKAIYEAMIDVSNVTDRSTSIHRQRFESERVFEEADLEAAAHNVFDEALAVHEKGWSRPLVYHKKIVRGKLVDRAAHSLELRLALVCELLREKKAAVDDALRGGLTLALLVDNPTARGFTKSSNDTGNEKKGKKLELARTVEEKEGKDKGKKKSQASLEAEEEEETPATQEAEAEETPETPEDNEDKKLQDLIRWCQETVEVQE